MRGKTGIGRGKVHGGEDTWSGDGDGDEFLKGRRCWSGSGMDLLGGYLCMEEWESCGVHAGKERAPSSKSCEKHEEHRVSEHVTFDRPSCIFRRREPTFQRRRSPFEFSNLPRNSSALLLLHLLNCQPLKSTQPPHLHQHAYSTKPLIPQHAHLSALRQFVKFTHRSSFAEPGNSRCAAAPISTSSSTTVNFIRYVVYLQ
jgi:hypothetical protein